MSIWQYVFLFFAVLLGGVMAFFFKQYNKTSLQLILSFCGSYLLGIIALHLLPEVFEVHDTQTGFWILGGFFVQLILGQLSMGVEHGHIHDHHHAEKRLVMQVLLGLSIHAFLEGLPMINHENLYYGVILHKAPEAFAFTLLLLYNHIPKRNIVAGLVFFSAMSPLGAGVSQLFGFSATLIQHLLALVIGSLLHVSTTILFEDDKTDEHHLSFYKVLAIGLGVGISLLTL
jgi:zinc transporter ZupT